MVIAILLSLRYIGCAITFAVASDLFHHNVTLNATEIMATKTIAGNAIVNPFRPEGLMLIKHTTELVANAQFDQLREILATNPLVPNRNNYGTTIVSAQEVFSLAHRWSSWLSSLSKEYTSS